MALIPYAGYEKPRRPRPNKDPIDAARALELREGGRSWSSVAEILSEEAGRQQSFRVDSVEGAVRKYKKEQNNVD